MIRHGVQQRARFIGRSLLVRLARRQVFSARLGLMRSIQMDSGDPGIAKSGDLDLERTLQKPRSRRQDGCEFDLDAPPNRPSVSS